MGTLIFLGLVFSIYMTIGIVVAAISENGEIAQCRREGWGWVTIGLLALGVAMLWWIPEEWLDRIVDRD